MLKPRVLSDVASGKLSAFHGVAQRVDLRRRKTRHFYFARILKFAAACGAAAYFLFGLASAPTIFTLASGVSGAPQDERQALEAKLQDLESQINQYEDQIAGYRKQGNNLQDEIGVLNSKIAKLSLQIQAVNLTLRELDQKIGDTETEIASTQSSIDDHKAALGVLVEELYRSESRPLVEVLLRNPTISGFFNDLNDISLLQDKLRVSIEQITDLKNQLQDKKDQFALARSDAASIETYQESQKQAISGVKEEKNQLLAETKGQESKYQSLLAESKASAAQIRSRIFQLLGGGELTFEQAYEYAKLAGSATGVSPALLLAVLDRESALGQNVGRCGYKTAMSLSSQRVFLQLMQELNLNPDIMTVSCPNGDGTYGGAMGPAQFTPSTWELYKDEVAQITKHSPPSPWNNADAFVATALYLEDALGGCRVIYTNPTSQNRCAAAKYYAGGRWQRYLWTYGEAVVSRAQQFESDIATITG